MIFSKIVALFLAILCSIHVQYGNGAVQDSRASDGWKNGFLFIGKKSFDKGNLIFTVCRRMTPNTTECRVIQKIYPQKGDAHACTITLEGDHDESNLDFTVGVATLGKDKVILYWAEDYNNSTTTKIATVNLETCKMNLIKIDDPKRNLITEIQMTDKIVAYDDDSFDVFINDPKRFGDKLGKIGVNADGTAKGEPKATNIKAGFVYYLLPIATRSASKGFAAMRHEEYALLLIKPDGSEKQLEKYNKTSRPAYSAGENVLNSCVKMNADSDVTCTEYDEDGNVKYTTTIADANKNIYPMAVNNLPGGGMLALLAEPKQCDGNSSCNESKYRIVKIAANGKIMGTARSNGSDSVSSERMQAFVYKFDNSEYCAVIIGDNPTIVKKKEDDYEILYDCIMEDEFKV